MQQGQTIVVALLVLLLLGFVGGLFASIVTRNLRNAGRSNRIQTSDYYAEAGIRFADDQLTQSLEGADWRPPLQNTLAATVYPANNLAGAAPYTLEQKRYNAAVASLNLLPADRNDPDKVFLDQGFTRYNTGTGRFLLRVTYDPVGLNNQSTAGARTIGTPYTDPRARYIKIEVVGREGTIDPTDPTTFVNQPAIRLAATLVEYKAIGITDYARFETNPDKRADIMALGVASAQYVSDFTDPNATTTLTLSRYPLVTTYGAPDAYLATGTAPNQILTPNPLVGSASSDATHLPGGGSIHVNGTARFYGQNFMYLNHGIYQSNGAYLNDGTVNQNAGSFGETAEIGGSLLLDNFTALSASNTLDKEPSGLAVNPASTGAATADYVTPSNAGATFDTHGGLVRDGGNGTDAAGLPRNANRLDPPVLETANSATNLPRYKALALDVSVPPRQSFNASTATGYGTTADPSLYGTNSAQYGYGRQGIYIDNTGDMQSESTSLLGGYTLVDEWLHRTASGQGSASWAGNFYRPPGVDIVLGRQQITSQPSGGTATVKTFYGVRMTRTDVDPSGAPKQWKDPDGTPITTPNVDGNTASTMSVSYTSLSASNDPTATPPTDTASAVYRSYQANPSNDVVIYAEGNVRVRGTVSASINEPSADASTEGTDMDQLPRHVTIVTNGTAYIDGSLLRGNASSSIAVLAHDYVCVNTTQFLAGAQIEENPTGTRPPVPYTGDPNLLGLDFSTSDEVLLQEFQYIAPTVANNTNPVAPPALYISGGPGSPGSATADFDLVNSATYLSLTTGNTGLFQSPFPPNAAPAAVSTFTSISTGGTPAAPPAGLAFGAGASGMTHITFPLTGGATVQAVSQAAAPSPLVPNQSYVLGVRREPGSDQSISTQDFLLERAAVLPADINIEAVLFAQTKSFFIIPGPSFNTSADDNLTTFINGTLRPSLTGLTPGSAEYTNRSRYPFYGQPIDMKIIIRGSVSEARPADISAQTAWMENWGWIPKIHGSLGGTMPEYSNRATIAVSSSRTSAPIGLTLLYNPLAGYPYMADTNTPANSSYLRTDIYGRPLPYTPKLPVCAGQLYAGQNSADQPLLQ